MCETFIKISSQHLRNKDKVESIDTFNVKSYELKSQEYLQNKLDRRSPMQFVLIKNKTNIFH